MIKKRLFLWLINELELIFLSPYYPTMHCVLCTYLRCSEVTVIV